MEWREFDIRLAAYAVIVQGDRILLALWNGPEVPRWTMPGGGVELDETASDAAIREVREESGYRVELGNLLGVDSEVIPADRRQSPGSRPLKAVRVIYEARVVGGELTNEIDGSTDEARWIRLADVPALHRVPLVDTAIGMWRAAVPNRAPVLVVTAGRPGTGKTTLAGRLATACRAAYLRVDAIETVLLRGGVADPGVLGYAALHEVAAGNLAAGTSVVIDAVNAVPEARAGWRELATRCGAGLVVLETVLPDSAEHRRRVDARRPELMGQRVPSWQEVEVGPYQPWDERRDGARTVIDMTDTEAGVAAALAVLGAARQPR